MYEKTFLLLYHSWEDKLLYCPYWLLGVQMVLHIFSFFCTDVFASVKTKKANERKRELVLQLVIVNSQNLLTMRQQDDISKQSNKQTFHYFIFIENIFIFSYLYLSVTLLFLSNSWRKKCNKIILKQYWTMRQKKG